MSLQSVLITGANRGIGLEIVRQLLASNCPPKHVIATTRQPLNEELDKLKALNPTLHVLHLDTNCFNQFNEFALKVEEIVDDLGLDTLINNAGIHIRSGVDEVTPQDMIENFEINAVVPLMLTKALLPLLKAAANKRKSAVINISSRLGSIELNDEEYMRFRSSYPYRTSKCALNMITKCLSIDLKPDGIHVISIHPGWVQTDMGGQTADLNVPTSVSHMLNTIESINESIGGKSLNYDGTVIPY